jgi:S-layer protein
MSAANPIYNETQALFLGLFGRPAAAPGLLSTASALAAHPNGTLGSLGSVAAADPSLYLNGDTSTSSQIELIFDRLTGREPLTPALTYMTDAVSSGTSSLGQIAALIYTNVSAEPSNYPFADLTVMNDKLTAANNFELQNPTYNSATYFAEGQTINTTITPISTAPAGQVIDITSTATNYVAAPGTGTVTFLDAGTSSGNIQPYDTINANGNVGTLEEYGSGTASSFFPTSMNGISTILLYDNNSSTLASPFNVSDIINTATSEPVANLIIDVSSTSTSTYYEVASTQSVTVENASSSTSSLYISESTSGATLNLTLENDSMSSTSVILYSSTSSQFSPTTINLESNGTAVNNIANLKVADNSTINISGSANLTISALDDASTSATSGITVDATQTGTLTLAVPTDLASTATFTFDGTGTGTDILNLTSAATSGVTYNLTGDSNSANTVNVDYLTSGSTLVDYVSAATGFSTLEFNSTSAAVTLDVAKISAGFTTFVDNASTSTSFTYNSVANNDTFSFTSLVSASTSAIINAAATGATVNVDLGHTHGGITLASLDLYNSTSAADSFSTINLESNGTSANTNTITALYAADHSTINITGTEALTISSSIGIADASSTPYSGSVYSGITVDAQNFTGTLNLTLDSASTSNIATASDTVIFGTGGGTVDTNLGNDTINTTYDISSSHVAAVDNYAIYSATGDTIQPNNIITMTDTNSTVNYSNDTIYFAADSTSGLLTSTSSMGSNAEKSGYFNTAMYGFSATPSSSEQAISQVINTLQTDITPATSVASTFDAAAWFQYGGNTYVVNAYDVSTASTSAVAATNTFTDQIVKLTGNVDLSHADVKSGVINHL